MIDHKQLIAAACETTGLSEFGSSPLMEPLERLVDALNTEAELNEFGAMRAEMMIQEALESRLKVEDYLRQHPDVLEQKIERPVFIAGLPRTGTTALSHMLNQDAGNHTPRVWEARDPVPPPEEASYRSDARIEAWRERLSFTEELLPGFSATHLLGEEEPDECYMLFGRNLLSVEFSALFHIPSYANWLYNMDQTELYRYHKVQLQLLQYKKGGHWILKAPFHQLGLPALMEVYPDAVIVQTHRSPKSIVASGSSFTELLRKSGSDKVDLNVVGSDWMEMLAIYTQTFERTREQAEAEGRGTFVDIYHDDFVADPWPGIEAIYQAAGLEFKDSARRAMQDWLDANPKGKHGKHSYRLEDYGLTEQDVTDLFADYMKRYQLSL